jgi:hypothetical protein
LAVKWWLGTTSGNFGTAANWSDAAAPVNSDTLIFDYRGNAGNDVNAGLATVLTGLTIYVDKSFTNDIGVLNATTATYLVIDGGTVHIGAQSGQGSSSGSSLVMINTGTTAATFNVYDSASTSSSTYYPPILIKGTVLTVNQFGGSVGIAALQAVAAGTAETATLVAGKVTKGAGSIDPSLFLGAGVTTTALYQSAGTVYSRSNQTQTLVEKTGGTYRYDGTGAHTTLTNYGGVVYAEGTGTITNLKNGGEMNFSRDPRAKTITNTEIYEGAIMDLRTGAPTGTPYSVTFTNGIDLIRCGLADVTIRTDPHATLTFTAV